MKNRKDKVFRFPFDIDTRIFLGLAFLFFILSIKSVQEYLHGTYNIKHIKKLVELDIKNKKHDANNTLSKKLVEDIALKGFKSDYANVLLKKPYGIFFYKIDSLLFWNRNNVMPLLHSPSKPYVAISNFDGEFIQHKIRIDDIDIYLLIDVSSSVFNSEKNKKGTNKVVTKSKNYFQINKNKVANSIPIFVDTMHVFYLSKNNASYMDDPSGWLLFLSAFPFIFMGISIHTYFKVIVQYKNKFLIFGGLILFTFGLRWLTLATGFPNNFSHFQVFTQSLFHYNWLYRSLGDSFVNVCLTFWILLFYIMNLQGYSQDNRLFRGRAWLSYIFYLLLFGINLFHIHLVDSIILHSDITFDTTLFSKIDLHSFIGVLTFMVALANVLLSNLIISNNINQLRIVRWKKYACLLLFGILILLSPKQIFSYHTLIFFIVLSILLFALMDNKRLRIKFDFNSYELILWIIIFSLVSTQFLILTIEQKEKNQRVDLAKKLVTNMELKHVAEPVFRIKEEIEKKDNYEKYNDPNLSESIKKLFFNHLVKLSNSFEIKLVTPDSNADPVHNTEKIYNAEHTDSIHAFHNEQESYLSFTMKPFTNFPSGLEIQLYKSFQYYNRGKKESSFKWQGNNFEEYDYNISIYKDSVLIINNGYPSIPSRISPGKLFKESTTFYRTKASTSILWHHDKNLNVSISISKTKNVFSRFLTLFACLFFVYFSVVSLYILGNIVARSNLVKKRFVNLLNINLRLRIHSTIIIIILISFICVGYFTTHYLISYYKINSKNKATEKLALHTTNFTKDLNRISDSAEIIRHVIGQCDKILKEQGIPINLFSKNNGQLIFSNGNLLNTINFPINKIAPLAYYDIVNKELDFLTYQESVHDDYFSTYSCLLNPLKAINLIVQIPYYNSNTYFKKETISVIVTLINTFVVVFLISAFIALLITNSVVQPFTYIVRQFTKINLSQTNEPLSWQYNDEIGLLVREYNRMLRKLENSSQQLARSEREMAWREMAKQVAHEIKNPLTPMKLSLQMLDKAIRENKSNLREMAERVTKTMVEQIDTLSVIATNFSSFARMPENKNEILLLNEVLNAVIGIYLNDKMVEYEFVIPSYRIHVFADKTQLIRVFTNIIQNAIQSVPIETKGNITLTVTKIQNNFVRVSIADNGVGISQERADKLFQPYFTTKSSGTGLGLAMSKDIIEHFNGRITFESIENEGTTFHIDLPIFDSDKGK